MGTKQLQLFTENLPKKPWAGDAKNTLRVMALQYAIRRAYIQHNQPKLAHWLVFDVDHPDVERWYDIGLPVPNYVAINRDNGHYHLAYAIVPVCISENARGANLKLLALVERAYQNALGADTGYAGLVSKNPLSSDWLVRVYHQDVADLHYLSDFRALNLDKAASELWGRERQYGGPQPFTGFRRHCHLFDALRYWAYSQVAQHTSYDAFFSSCLSKAENLNDYPEPLPHSHVKSTAKSVARWTWRNREHFAHYKPVNRGAMGLQGAQLDTREKQAAAGEWTNMQQRERTETAIVEAIAQLKSQGKRVSKAAVGRMIGMSRQKVSENYSHLF